MSQVTFIWCGTGSCLPVARWRQSHAPPANQQLPAVPCGRRPVNPCGMLCQRLPCQLPLKLPYRQPPLLCKKLTLGDKRQVCGMQVTSSHHLLYPAGPSCLCTTLTCLVVDLHLALGMNAAASDHATTLLSSLHVNTKLSACDMLMFIIFQCSCACYSMVS